MTDFNRSDEAQEIFKAKRKPKGPIKFNIPLNEEQKRAKEQILNTPITLIRGMAGSGKTLLACQIALDLLFNKEIEKINIDKELLLEELETANTIISAQYQQECVVLVEVRAEYLNLKKRLRKLKRCPR